MDRSPYFEMMMGDEEAEARRFKVKERARTSRGIMTSPSDILELYTAVQTGNLKVVKKVLAACPALVDNPRDGDGLTVLLAACLSGQTKVVEYLLSEFDLDINQVDEQGLTCLQRCAMTLDEQMCEFLLDTLNASTSIPCPANGFFPIHYAARGGSDKIVSMLLNHGSNPDCATASGATPIILAAREGHIEAVNALICGKADVNSQTTLLGRTALHVATQTGRLEVVVALVKAGADTQIKDRFKQKPVDVATDECIASFLKDHDTPDTLIDPETKDTIFHTAVAAGCLPVVRRMMKKYPGANNRNALGQTPVWVAVDRQAWDVLKVLAESGCDCDEPDSNGVSPIARAAQLGDSQTFSYLLSRKVDTQCRDCNGYTIAHFAALNGHINIIRIMLKTIGSDILDATANNSRTPLYLAAKENQPKAVLFLIQCGAYRELADDKGKKPVDVAANRLIKDIFAVADPLPELMDALVPPPPPPQPKEPAPTAEEVVLSSKMGGLSISAAANAKRLGKLWKDKTPSKAKESPLAEESEPANLEGDQEEEEQVKVTETKKKTKPRTSSPARTSSVRESQRTPRTTQSTRGGDASITRTQTHTPHTQGASARYNSPSRQS